MRGLEVEIFFSLHISKGCACIIVPSKQYINLFGLLDPKTLFVHMLLLP